MDKHIKNFIRIVEQIKMTEEENAAVRTHITTFAKKNNIGETPLHFKIPSPYFSQFSFALASKLIGFALLFVVVGISGLSYASASALPGDILYTVKITKEKIEESFVSTPEQKIALKQKHIETRFKEVETLIKEKKITPANRSIAEAKIQQDKIDINTDIEAINKENPQAVIDAKTSLDASIQEHQDKIDVLIEQTAGDTTNETDFDGESTVDTTTPPIITPDTAGTTITVPSTTNPADPTTTPKDGSVKDLKVTPETGTTTAPIAPSPIDNKTPKAQ